MERQPGQHYLGQQQLGQHQPGQHSLRNRRSDENSDRFPTSNFKNSQQKYSPFRSNYDHNFPTQNPDFLSELEHYKKIKEFAEHESQRTAENAHHKSHHSSCSLPHATNRGVKRHHESEVCVNRIDFSQPPPPLATTSNPNALLFAKWNSEPVQDRIAHFPSPNLNSTFCEESAKFDKRKMEIDSSVGYRTIKEESSIQNPNSNLDSVVEFRDENFPKLVKHEILANVDFVDESQPVNPPRRANPETSELSRSHPSDRVERRKSKINRAENLAETDQITIESKTFDSPQYSDSKRSEIKTEKSEIGQTSGNLNPVLTNSTVASLDVAPSK